MAVEYTPTGNIIGPKSSILDWADQDIHQQARDKTRRHGQPSKALTVKAVALSLAGRPTVQKTSYALAAALGYEKSALIPDLNKYRPGVNLKALREEMGIDHIILRMGGPRQFVYENWLLTEDETWRAYFTEAVKLGYKSIGGYFVYSAGVDSQDYVNGHGLFDAIRDWTSGGFVPDFIIADDEVNTWYENGRKVTATDVNQTKGLKYLFPKIWDKWRRPLMHYSARWFLNIYPQAYATLFDNFNQGYAQQGVAGKQVLNWYAWYINEFNGKSTQYTSEIDVQAGIPLPTSDQQKNYLTMGSWSLYDLHQFTSTLITPWAKNAVTGAPIGIDFSITRQTESEWMQAINKAGTPSEPPTEPPTEPPAGDVAKRLAAVEAQQEKLTAWARTFPGPLPE